MNALKGLFAGVLGGLVATYAKTIWEDHFPVRSVDTETPPALLAQRVTDRRLSVPERQTAETAIHWTFGTVTGALYGAAAESLPAVAAGAGLPFGIAFWVGTHGTVVPAAGLEPFPTEVKPRQYAVNEFAGHLVYALALEVVRRGVRQVF